MIQRIQSIYFLLVTLISVGMFFINISQIAYSENLNQDKSIIIKLDVLSLQKIEGQDLTKKESLLPITSLAIIVCLISLFSIFMYKKRRFQILLGRFNLLLIIGLIISIFFYIEKAQDMLPNANLDTQYLIGVYLPIFQLILTILAINAIRKDEELVRSADRLR